MKNTLIIHSPLVFISCSLMNTSVSESGVCMFSSNEEQHPPIAVLTLQQQLLLHEVLSAYWTSDEAGTGATVGVVVLPLTVETWRVGTTLHTAHTPAQKT